MGPVPPSIYGNSEIGKHQLVVVRFIAWGCQQGTFKFLIDPMREDYLTSLLKWWCNHSCFPLVGYQLFNVGTNCQTTCKVLYPLFRLSLWEFRDCTITSFIEQGRGRAGVYTDFTLRLWSTVWHTCTHVGQSPYKTLGYMCMNISRQFARTIIDRETVCKAVLILQQQR